MDCTGSLPNSMDSIDALIFDGCKREKEDIGLVVLVSVNNLYKLSTTHLRSTMGLRMEKKRNSEMISLHCEIDHLTLS